jgi:hypothetical protein
MNPWIKRAVGAAGAASVAGGVVLGAPLAASADSSVDEQRSSGSGSVSAPVEIGGVSAGLERSGSSHEEGSTTRTDEDGTSSSSSRSAEESHERVGVDVGELRAEPTGSVSRGDASRDASVGGPDGVRESESASRSAADFSSPFRFAGVDLMGERWTSSMEEYSSVVSDEDGTVAERGSRHDESHESGHLSVGEIAGDPAGSVSDERHSATSQSGDDRASSEDSATDGDLSLPYESEGGEAAAEDTTHTATETERGVADEDGTTVTRDSHEDTSSTKPSGELDGASGDLAGDGVLGDTRDSLDLD